MPSVYCGQKGVKDAYHVICKACARKDRKCEKCLESRDLDGKKAEIRAAKEKRDVEEILKKADESGSEEDDGEGGCAAAARMAALTLRPAGADAASDHGDESGSESTGSDASGCSDEDATRGSASEGVLCTHEELCSCDGSDPEGSDYACACGGEDEDCSCQEAYGTDDETCPHGTGDECSCFESCYDTSSGDEEQ